MWVDGGRVSWDSKGMEAGPGEVERNREGGGLQWAQEGSEGLGWREGLAVIRGGGVGEG
jgi:hypothetical protein